MKVAIITLNYNGRKDTIELLKSLEKLPTTNYELRTIVVDNGSSDGSVSAIKKQYPKVDILQTGQNLGYAGGFNKGIEYASVWGADYFLLINNDILIKDQNLLDELIKTLESDPKIGLVSPKIYFAKGYEFHKERYKASDLGKVIWFAGGKFDWDNIGSNHRGLDEVDDGQYDEVAESEIISGACVLIKREVFAGIGVFDEKYFLYFEDSDFSKKATDAGFKKYYNGKVALFHKVSQSTGIGSEITDYYHTRNRLIFGMKYGKLRTKFALLREALRLFIFGRPSQRKGVLDFYLGITGEMPGVSTYHTPGVGVGKRLSIGIVNYKTADLTKKLLESIFNKESGFNASEMEVIVLDNGSQDSCKEVIKEFLPKIKYLENKENEGFSKGYNKTISYSLGQYYLMLNSDIEVLPEGLSEILKIADGFKGKAALSGKLFFPDKSDQDSVYHLPTITGAFKEYFLGQSGSYFMFQPKSEKPVQVEGAVMACFLIPKHIIYNVGLLDEGTFIYFEDIEYCRRLKRSGVPIYFVPSACFIHHHGAASKKIGEDLAKSLLNKAAVHYHGKIYYQLITLVLWMGQKLGRVKTPISRWVKD